MKCVRQICLSFAFGILFSASAHAVDGLGLGVILGEPTGLSGRMDYGSSRAIDAALAWSLGDRGYVHFHFDYLWLRPDSLQIDGESLELFYGIGARIKNTDRDRGRNHRDDDRTQVGIRAPGGLAYRFKDPRLEVFGEIALILDLIEETDLDLNAGLGVRYYF